MQKSHTSFYYLTASLHIVRILIVIAFIVVVQLLTEYSVSHTEIDVSGNFDNNGKNEMYLPGTPCGKEQQLQWQIETERGRKGYEEILAEVYEKYGLVHDYDSNKQCLSSTLFPLKKKAALQCSKVFSDFLDTSKIPLRKFHGTTIPSDLKDQFLLNGYSKLIENFRNDTSLNSDIALEWGTSEAIGEITRIIKEKRFRKLAYRGAGGLSGFKISYIKFSPI